MVDNASTDNTASVLAHSYPAITILTQSENHGIAEGRNIGMRQAKGAICICLDDDIELTGHDAIRKAAEYFNEDSKLACLAMRIVDPSDQVILKYICRRDRKLISHDHEVAMFCGGACVFRREAFFQAGEFWHDLDPYFGEEPDLSYRLIDRGYHLMQTVHIVARHYNNAAEFEEGRKRRIYHGTRNTLWITLRSLPWYSVIGLTILSWGYFLLLALYYGHVRIYGKAIISSLKHAPAVFRIRRPIKKTTRAIIWKNSGLILY